MLKHKNVCILEEDSMTNKLLYVYFLQGALCASTIMCMEIFPLEQRSIAGTAIQFFWALGHLLVTPFAYYIRNWRYLTLAISGSVALFVPVFGFVRIYIIYF